MLAFSLGRHIFVYPVLDRGRRSVKVWLPPGRYRHLFTNELVEGGRLFRATAPIGRPAVFVSEDYEQVDGLISAVSELTYAN